MCLQFPKHKPDAPIRAGHVGGNITIKLYLSKRDHLTMGWSVAFQGVLWQAIGKKARIVYARQCKTRPQCAA